MKKIVTLFLIIMLAIHFFSVLQTVTMGELEISLRNNASLSTIKKIDGELSEPKKFSEAIKTYAKEHGVAIVGIVYPFQGNNEKNLCNIYIESNSVPEFLNSYILESQFEYIINSDKIMVSGVDFSIFSKKIQYTIQSFSQLKNISLNRNIYVFPKEAGNEFIKYFSSEKGVEFNDVSETVSENYFTEHLYNDIALSITLFLTLFVLLSFWVSSEYKVNSVKILLGTSDFVCISRMLLQFVVMLIIAFGITVSGFIIYLFFYNNLSNFTVFFNGIFQILSPIIVLTIVCGILSILLFYSNDIKLTLKGKKPNLQLAFTAILLKILVLVLVCITSVTAILSINQFRKFDEQKKYWESVNEYSFIEIYINPNDRAGFDGTYDNYCKSFAGKVENIIIDSSRIKIAREWKQDVIDSETKYYYNTIFVNQNYLQVNPIIDLQGLPVNIEEEKIAKNEMIILVPEQYKNEAELIYKEFNQFYSELRYIGEKNKEGSVIVKLLFVKDNQKYFAFDYSLADYSNNIIMDPFAVIVTDHNMNPSEYMQYLSSYSFMFKNEDDTNNGSINEHLNESELSNILYNTPTVYSCVDEQIRTYQVAFIKAFLLLSISVGIILAISIYLTKLYLDEFKQLHSIKIFLGYSRFAMHKNYFLVILIADLAFFIIASLLNKHVYWIEAITIILLDCFIMFIILFLAKQYANHVKLKGE